MSSNGLNALNLKSILFEICKGLQLDTALINAQVAKVKKAEIQYIPIRHHSPGSTILVKKWIEQGARWDQHWAFVPVNETPTSHQYQGEAAFDFWAKNEIDYFIYDKIRKQKLTVSESAELPILARRLSIDLIGLPPPADAFNTLTGSTTPQNWDMYMKNIQNSNFTELKIKKRH